MKVQSVTGHYVGPIQLQPEPERKRIYKTLTSTIYSPCIFHLLHLAFSLQPLRYPPQTAIVLVDLLYIVPVLIFHPTSFPTNNDHLFIIFC